MKQIERLDGLMEHLKIDYSQTIAELGDNWGNINVHYGIRIAKDITKVHQKQTLLHEIIHYCSDFSQIGLEEKQVEALGNSLFAILRANPELLIIEEE